jgi:NTP pyrophosphatase (non-canonical NTP hydrolase)
MSANTYRDIYEKISASQVRVSFFRQAGPAVRLVKLQEEAGEVAEAFIGFLGANARKGYTHTEEDVAKEIADVVITAMVALHDWVPSPDLFMKERLDAIVARIKEEGS